MLLHLVTHTFRPEVTDEQVAEMAVTLAEVPARIPHVRWYQAGPALGLWSGNADFGTAVVVDDAAALDAYARHPFHEACARRFSPLVADRSAVQIALSEAAAAALLTTPGGSG